MPTTILLPKHQIPKGRPKKMTTSETGDIVKNGNLCEAWKSVTCDVCGNVGHNKRTCLGQGGLSRTQSSGTKSHFHGNQTWPQPRMTRAKSKSNTQFKGNNVEGNKQAHT
jgi:hypothetical protein